MVLNALPEGISVTMRGVCPDCGVLTTARLINCRPDGSDKPMPALGATEDGKCGMCGARSPWVVVGFTLAGWEAQREPTEDEADVDEGDE